MKYIVFANTSTSCRLKIEYYVITKNRNDVITAVHSNKLNTISNLFTISEWSTIFVFLKTMILS